MIDVVLDEVGEAGQFVVAVSSATVGGDLECVVEESDLVASECADRDLETSRGGYNARKVWILYEVDIV